MALRMAHKYLNHTSFRIADPKRSIEFYEKNFGLKLLKTLELKQQGVSNYILGLTGPNSAYQNSAFYNRGGLLQLTHKHGTTPENFQANNGNKEPYRGFGHICFSVANLETTCEDLEKANVKFQKRLVDGRQKNIAFALDPDGYWIELIANGKTGPETLSESSARLNHSMIRVKDKDASLDFYTKKLGMSLVHKLDFPEAKFTLYFLSYEPEKVEQGGIPSVEGLIELTYNYGSEKDDKVVYHTGNTDPVGFSHFGISVDDPHAFAEELKTSGVKTEVNGEESKEIAYVSDPDGYLIQLLPKSDYSISGRI